ncbi:MAG: hypothetical protein IKZ03_03075, partial [Clostridia bacterium]|nr:hypothetical protein [Clostridia bacterium]
PPGGRGTTLVVEGECVTENYTLSNVFALSLTRYAGAPSRREPLFVYIKPSLLSCISVEIDV